MRKKKEKIMVKNATFKDQITFFIFSSCQQFPFIGAIHHSIQPHAFNEKPRNAISVTMPTCHFDKFTIG